MTNNIFGTDGIRTIVGKSPFTMQQLPKLGQAIALWALQKYGNTPTILLAHDTRMSCSMIKSALKSGLLLFPITLSDAAILPSPALVSIMQQYPQFDCGIMVSASHNAYQDNGIKIIDARQGKLSLADEIKITTLFHAELNHYDYTTLGQEYWWQTAERDYQTALLNHFPASFLANKKIVLDCAHGAAYNVAPKIFEACGAEVIALNTQPNGTNINHACGSLHPQQLQKAVTEYQADAGFAFDGDADRVVAVTRQGHLKNGDDLLALLLMHPSYAAAPAIVGTIMTNQGFEHFLTARHKKLLRTSVGDKYVADALVEHHLLLGGEQSGHIIMRDYLATGDGIFSALRTLQSIILHDNWDMITFTKFPQLIINIPVGTKKDLSQSPLSDIIMATQEKLITGRLIVRYSGTESCLRIMIEDQDFEYAQSLGSYLSQQLQQELL